jgi:hypothetical protein
MLLAPVRDGSVKSTEPSAEPEADGSAE